MLYVDASDISYNGHMLHDAVKHFRVSHILRSLNHCHLYTRFVRP